MSLSFFTHSLLLHLIGVRNDGIVGGRTPFATAPFIWNLKGNTKNTINIY